MKILAFDTSTEYCSVALYLDGETGKTETLAGHRHSELLLPMIRETLNQGRLELTDIDGLAFGAGPGSFTGLRIACGVAQGLAFAASLPVIGISTLQAIAHQNTHDKIIVAIDARMGEIYHAAYPHAQEIAQLAAAKGISDFHTDPAQAAPVYLRNKVALKESER